MKNKLSNFPMIFLGKKFEQILLVLAIVLLFITFARLFEHISHVSDPLIRNDEFRVIDTGYEFFQGNFLALFSTESPFYSVHIKAILEIFEGDFRYSILLVILSIFGILALFVLDKESDRNTLKVSTIILLLAIYVIPSALVTYQWPLVFSAFTYYITFAALVIYFANRVHRNLSRKTVTVFIIVTALIVFGSPRYALFLPPVLGSLIVYRLPEKWRWGVISVGLLAFAPLYIIASSSEHSISETLHMFGMAELKSFIPGLKEGPIFVLLLPLASAALVLWNMGKARYFVPTTFTLTLLFVCLGVIYLRGLVGPRHFPIFKGLVLATIYLGVTSLPLEKIWSRSIVFVGTVFGVIVLLSGYSTFDGFTRVHEVRIKPYRDARFLATYMRAYEDSIVGNFSLSKYTAGHNSNQKTKHVLGLFSERNLNVFREDHLGSAFIPAYERSRRVFSTKNSEEHFIDVPMPSACIKVAAASTKRAFELSAENRRRVQHFSVRAEGETAHYYPLPQGGIKLYGELGSGMTYDVCRPNSEDIQNLKFRIQKEGDN